MNKQAYNLIFGRFIRDCRAKFGLSQAELAAKIGHNAQNVSRIERGELSPTLYWCSELLAPAFDMTLIDFIKEFEIYKSRLT